MGGQGSCGHRLRTYVAGLGAGLGCKLLIFPSWWAVWGTRLARPGCWIRGWAVHCEPVRRFPALLLGCAQKPTVRRMQALIFGNGWFLEKESMAAAVPLWNKWLKVICCQWALNMSQAVQHQKGCLYRHSSSWRHSDAFSIDVHTLSCMRVFLLRVLTTYKIRQHLIYSWIKLCFLLSKHGVLWKTHLYKTKPQKNTARLKTKYCCHLSTKARMYE